MKLNIDITLKCLQSSKSPYVRTINERTINERTINVRTINVRTINVSTINVRTYKIMKLNFDITLKCLQSSKSIVYSIKCIIWQLVRLFRCLGSSIPNFAESKKIFQNCDVRKFKFMLLWPVDLVAGGQGPDCSCHVADIWYAKLATWNLVGYSRQS